MPGREAESSVREAAVPVREAGTHAPDGDDVDVEALRRDLDSAMTEIEELKDKFLRAKAETENTRRRADNEVANVRNYAIERFASEMLTVRDSLELAKAVDLDEQDATALERIREIRHSRRRTGTRREIGPRPAPGDEYSGIQRYSTQSYSFDYTKGIHASGSPDSAGHGGCCQGGGTYGQRAARTGKSLKKPSLYPSLLTIRQLNRHNEF